MLKRIYVDRGIIDRNRRGKELRPPLCIRTYKGAIRAFSVEIDGPCRIIYAPHKPMSQGAHLWIETESSVIPHPHGS